MEKKYIVILGVLALILLIIIGLDSISTQKASDALLDGFEKFEIITSKTGKQYEMGLKNIKDGETIKNIEFRNIPVGIGCFCSNLLIENCRFINCNDEGIVFLSSSNNNTVKNCFFYNCSDGVELQQSCNNVFIDCDFIDNYHAGVDGILDSNNYNKFINCTFKGNYYGAYFAYSVNNEFIDCVFQDNEHDCRYLN